MPRNVDPGSIKVGKGLAPEGTVEDNSLRYPERDADPLRVHIHDPSRAHMASSIGIVDEGDCYVSDEVEGALQEICGGAGAGRLNGLISGGTFNELGNVANGSGSVATTTLTLETTTEIMVGPGVFDASALVADLSGLAAGDYYVYFDTNSSSASYRTLVVSPTVPQVETATGIEHVLLAKFSYDAGGNVTAWQDGRFFVRNLDRKVQYSSRQGENVDAWSEGCFATLEAFFLWMAEYGEGSGSPSEEEKGTVIIRGEHIFSATLTVPTSHLQFVGDGNAVFETTLAGFTGTRLFDLSGRTNITFRNITFVAQTAGLTALYASGQTLTDLRVEDCTFSAAGTRWDRGVDFGNTASTGANVFITDSTFHIPTNAGGGSSHLGVNLYGITHARVTGSNFIGNGLQDTLGVYIGETNHKCEDVVISDCHIKDVDIGLRVEFADHVKVTDNTIVGVAKGVISDRGTNAPNNNAPSSDYLISGNTVECAANGFVGISLKEVVAVTIEANNLDCPGAGPFTPNAAKGIEYTTAGGGTGMNGVPTDLRILGNNIVGWGKPVNSSSIIVEGGGAGNAVKNVVISGNTILQGEIRLTNIVEHFSITNNTLDGLIPGDPLSLSDRAIIITTVNTNTPQNGVVSGNIIRRYKDGILLLGGAAAPIKSVDVDQNHLSEIVASYDGSATDTFNGFGTKGIGLLSCEHCSVTRNTITGMGEARDNAGSLIVLPNNIQCVPVYVRDCAVDIRTEQNTIFASKSQGTGKVFGIVYVIGAGVTGAFTATDHIVSSNVVNVADTNDQSFAGVWFNIGDSANAHMFSLITVRENNIEGGSTATAAPSYGILFQSQVISSGNVTGAKFDAIRIEDNSILSFRLSGIAIDNDAGANQTQPCDIRNIDIARNQVQSTDPVPTQDQEGVVVKVTADASDSFLNAVSVKDNKILMPTAPNGGTHYGVYLHSDNTASTSQMRGLTVIGNRIPTITQGYGVVIAREGDHSVSRRHDWSVSENRIGLGNTQTVTGLNPQEGITINIGEVALYGLRVEGNEVTVDPATGNARSLYILMSGSVTTPTTTAHMDWLINDNRFAMRGTTVLSARDGSYIDLFDSTVNGIECSGNLFSHRSSTGVGYGMHMRFRNLKTATPLTLRGITIVGNNVSNGAASGGLKLVMEGMDAEGITINGNSVGGPTLSAPSLTTLAGAIQIDATAGTISEMILENLSVVGNNVVGGPVGIWLNMVDVAKQRGIRVSDNNLRDNPPLNGQSFGYSIRHDHTGTLDAAEAINITINDNTCHTSDVTDPPYVTLFRFSAVLNAIQIRGLSICGNELTGVGGMNITLTPTAQSRYVNVKVDNNTITGKATEQDDYPDLGMIFDWTAPNDDTKHILQNFSFSHNQIDVQGGAGEEVRGMWIKFQQRDSFPSFLHGLSVDGNRVQVIREGQEDPTYCSAIEVEMTCNAENISTSDNIIDYLDEGAISDQRLNQYGLRLYHDFQTGQGVLDTGGGWSNTTSYQIGEFLPDPAVGGSRWDFFYNNGTAAADRWRAVRWESVRVNNNNIRFSAGASTPSDYTKFAFPDYAALNIGNSQIVATGVGQNAVQTLRTVCLWGLTVVGNVLRSCKQNNVPIAPGGTTGNDLPLVGLLMGVVPATAAWPGDAAVGRAPMYTCRGWVISDNSATDFCREDFGDPSQFFGFDVRVLFRDNQTHSTWTHSSVKGNISQDNGQAAVTAYLTFDGFKRFDADATLATDNIESDPRTF